MTQALARTLGDDCMTGCRIDEIHATDQGYQVVYSDREGAVGSAYCRRLVLGTAASEAARLLGPVVPDAAEQLMTIESVPMLVLNLGFRRADIGHPLKGFGFLVPRNEPEYPLMGILWANSIFPHHAPPDHCLIRVFIGGSRDPNAIERSDDELLASAMDASRGLLSISGDPVLTDICRWPAAIPQYGLGYLDKIARLNAVVAAQPNLYLIGNYMEGVSLNDCVRCATRAANELIRTTEPMYASSSRALAAS